MMKDKKINAIDLPILVDVLTKFPEIVEAVKEIDEVPAEVKDLSQEELITLAVKVFSIVKSIKDAVK